MMVKGFSYGYDANRGMFFDPRAKASVKRLAGLGGNWAAICLKIAQNSFSSTSFGFDYRYDLTDREIEHMVKIQKDCGLKVCLKPILNLAALKL